MDEKKYDVFLKDNPNNVVSEDQNAKKDYAKTRTNKNVTPVTSNSDNRKHASITDETGSLPEVGSSFTKFFRRIRNYFKYGYFGDL